MSNHNQQRLFDEPTINIENLCDDCLQKAVKEYLGRATHKQLRELVAQASLRLTNPCTELCEEDCFDDEDN